MFQKLENKYNIKLDDTQKSVLSNLINFCTTKTSYAEVCVSGKAGSGKTSIIKWLVELIGNNYSIVICAPTHKSLYVLRDKINNGLCEFNTLHNFLGLSPNFDILEFDAKNMQFDQTYTKYKVYDIIIVDEASMLNNELYGLLSSLTIHSNCKIIYVGDKAQLAPVNQIGISKVFSLPKFELQTVYRQKESCLYPILDTLRVQSLNKFNSVEDNTTSIIVNNNIQDMLKSYSYLFKFASDCKDVNFIKMITYTNNRIEALNKFIRSCIYKDDIEYHYGEILTGYDRTKKIENAQDYIVLDCSPTLCHDAVAYKLQLQSIDGECEVVVLSRNNSDATFKRLAAELETLRLEALHTKSQYIMRERWHKFFKFSDSIITPVDLIYEGRVIKKKTIDYGYCISAHKSQASEYQNVLIDMENILRCKNKETLRQLQYVAMSRTKGNIIIYQKDE